MTNQKYPELQRRTGYTDKQGVFIKFKSEHPKIKMIGNNLHDDKNYDVTLLSTLNKWDKGEFPNYTAFAKFTGTEEAFTMELGAQGYMAMQEAKAGKFTMLSIKKGKGEKGAILLIQNMGQQQYKPEGNTETPTPQPEKDVAPNPIEQDLWNMFSAKNITEKNVPNWIAYYVKADKLDESYEEVVSEARAKKLWELFILKG